MQSNGQKLQKILVTGGAGFIGSEFVRQGAKDCRRIVVVDNLSYAGDLARLKDVRGGITFYKVDISQREKLEAVFRKEKPAQVVHFAAETHVDRSIKDARPFLNTNIVGTQNIIECAMKHGVKKMVHISTDEIYGQSTAGWFKETDPIQPRNPYSATKASAELLVNAARLTYGLPAVIVRPSNNYGLWQYPEKFLPVIISNALKDQAIPVYGKGAQIREWLHVSDCARAIYTVLKKGKVGEVYNIGTKFESRNIDTVKNILKLLGKSEDLITFVPDRLGHDFRYSVAWDKLKKLGWSPKVSFKDGIRQTIEWYTKNQRWVERKKNEE
jgi:dTDP-glucose 4,6-dehydratase